MVDEIDKISMIFRNAFTRFPPPPPEFIVGRILFSGKTLSFKLDTFQPPRHLPLLFPCLARGTVSVVPLKAGNTRDRGVSTWLKKKKGKENLSLETMPYAPSAAHCATHIFLFLFLDPLTT